MIPLPSKYLCDWKSVQLFYLALRQFSTANKTSQFSEGHHWSLRHMCREMDCLPKGNTMTTWPKRSWHKTVCCNGEELSISRSLFPPSRCSEQHLMILMRQSTSNFKSFTHQHMHALLKTYRLTPRARSKPTLLHQYICSLTTHKNNIWFVWVSQKVVLYMYTGGQENTLTGDWKAYTLTPAQLERPKCYWSLKRMGYLHPSKTKQNLAMTRE